MHRPINYILKPDHTVEPCDDLAVWAEGFERTRQVRHDQVGTLRVSTVFLGIDHGWGDGPPLLFETMIFGSVLSDEYQERYSTWDEAIVGHQKALAWVKRHYPAQYAIWEARNAVARRLLNW